MEKFVSLELKLSKNVKRGDNESLLSLFSFRDRIKRTPVLLDLEEEVDLKVIVEGLGETRLKLGADMEKGQNKTIMTLFWHGEKSKVFEMARDAQAGEFVILNLWKD
jgi:hypothetical protein